MDYQCRLPPAVPHPAAAAVQRYNWIGIAWSNEGAWATRPAETRDQAQALALAACEGAAGIGKCYNVTNPVPGDQHMCMAIYRKGSAMSESHAPDLEVAKRSALENCASRGDANATCELLMNACNDRR
jgi:hypothetical protein